jgi:xylan 1,4-beta-xylosidase
MGSPRELSTDQLAQLNAMTTDEAEIDREIVVAREEHFKINVPMRKNDVVLVTLRPQT